MRNLCAALALMASICVPAAADAACGDAYYNSISGSRVAANVALIRPGDLVLVGDSHFEGLETTYAQRAQTIAGRPVVILGSAGATWQTLRDCFPWAQIAARAPGGIYLQASINDAISGQCCDANGNATSAYALAIMGAVENAHAALGAAWPAIGTSPPPESAAGIAPYPLFQAGRMVYYVASFCGGACAWSAFGWNGAAPPGPLQFIDQYVLMAGSACDASSIPYAGHPCAAAPGATRDNVHFPHDGNVAMIGNLAGLP